VVLCVVAAAHPVDGSRGMGPGVRRGFFLGLGRNNVNSD
jgi:hypothetical protein